MPVQQLRKVDPRWRLVDLNHKPWGFVYYNGRGGTVSKYPSTLGYFNKGGVNTL